MQTPEKKNIYIYIKLESFKIIRKFVSTHKITFTIHVKELLAKTAPTVGGSKQEECKNNVVL